MRIENENLDEREKEKDSHRLLSLLRKIRELEEVVNITSTTTSLSQLTPNIPKGYTPARWQLALQSFNRRYPILKSRDYFSSSSSSSQQIKLNLSTLKEEIEPEFEIEMGPEWELKCAQKELENLLNK